MSTSFEKTNWDWQSSLFLRQAGEWIEYQLSRFEGTIPNWSLPGWSINAESVLKLLNFLFWFLVCLFLAWLIWQLWREFSPYLYSWLGNGNFQGKTTKNNSTELTSAGWLARSQEFYRQGNYHEACRCLYLAMLQQLHDRNVLPHKKSRTDGEYLQILQLSVTPMQPYETLITTHEQLCFNSAELLPENYQQCEQAYQQITNP
jgi:hypothetical protein